MMEEAINSASPWESIWTHSAALVRQLYLGTISDHLRNVPLTAEDP